MFTFKTEGSIQGISQSKDLKRIFVKIKPPEGFKFEREGEIPGSIDLTLTPEQAKGIALGMYIHAEGQGAMGLNDWEQYKFGKTKIKQIANYYFVVSAIKVKA